MSYVWVENPLRQVLHCWFVILISEDFKVLTIAEHIKINDTFAHAIFSVVDKYQGFLHLILLWNGSSTDADKTQDCAHRLWWVKYHFVQWTSCNKCSCSIHFYWCFAFCDSLTAVPEVAISICIYGKCNDSAREVWSSSVCLSLSLFAITCFSFWQLNLNFSGLWDMKQTLYRFSLELDLSERY